MVEMNRRTWLQGAAATLTLAPQAWAKAPTGWVGLQLSQGRPAPGGRRFTSAAVDALIPRIQRRIADPALAAIFENCFRTRWTRRSGRADMRASRTPMW